MVFRSLKTEKLCGKECETEQELKACIENYIRQYNTVRPHMALDYKTRFQFLDPSFPQA